MVAKNADRMRELESPGDLWDDVSGSVMTERETEGKDTKAVSGRWTGIYVKRGDGWRLTNVFCCRRDAYHYFSTLNDGADYRIAPLRGALWTVAYGK